MTMRELDALVDRAWTHQASRCDGPLPTTWRTPGTITPEQLAHHMRAAALAAVREAIRGHVGPLEILAYDTTHHRRHT